MSRGRLLHCGRGCLAWLVSVRYRCCWRRGGWIYEDLECRVGHEAREEPRSRRRRTFCFIVVTIGTTVAENYAAAVALVGRWRARGTIIFVIFIMIRVFTIVAVVTRLAVVAVTVVNQRRLARACRDWDVVKLCRYGVILGSVYCCIRIRVLWARRGGRVCGSLAVRNADCAGNRQSFVVVEVVALHEVAGFYDGSAGSGAFCAWRFGVRGWLWARGVLRDGYPARIRHSRRVVPTGVPTTGCRDRVRLGRRGVCRDREDPHPRQGGGRGRLQRRRGRGRCPCPGRGRHWCPRHMTQEESGLVGWCGRVRLQ